MVILQNIWKLKRERSTYLGWLENLSLPLTGVLTSHSVWWWPFLGRWKPENGEMWFSCKSRPQRCIFQHRDIFRDRRDVFSNFAPRRFRHQPGASFVYYLPEKQEKWAEISHKGKSGERALNCNILMVDAELWDRRKQFHILKKGYHFSLFEE